MMSHSIGDASDILEIPSLGMLKQIERGKSTKQRQIDQMPFLP
jgi:hypothetical protein